MDNRTERIIALVAACFILIFVMALIWRNQPFATPDLARAMRIILSLGVGVLGGTIPGFLNLEYNLQGLAVRAGGALALFALTFFGSPAVEPLHLQAPKIVVSDIPQIDFRTRAGPDKPDDERLDAEAVVTVAISVRNIEEPSRSGFLDTTRVDVPIDGTRTQFSWRYFVNMHEEAFGLWLAIQSDATPQPLKAGDVLGKEILHTSVKGIKWRDILDSFKKDAMRYETAYVHLIFGTDDYVKPCQYDVQKWQREIERFTKQTGRVPGRVTADCVKG
jgi:hypothetical protein